jgi:hypothetical protein
MRRLELLEPKTEGSKSLPHYGTGWRGGRGDPRDEGKRRDV